MGDWEKVSAENLIRHRSGTYYLNAKVRGKKIRESLGTQSLKVAKIKRDTALTAYRSASVAEPAHVRTLGDAINLVVAREASNPRTKPRTKESYEETAAAVRKTAPVDSSGASWTADAARRWWRDHTKKHAASQANKALSLMKKAAAVLIEAGVRHDNPTKNLKRMREKVSAVEDLPTVGKVLEVIEDIRGQKKRVSEESANMVSFLLWSGLRMGEMQGMRWEDVGSDWITVRDGKSGRRKVPISGPLREVIGRMSHEHATGPIFKIKTPRLALGAACKRAGIGHLRIHDLRHLFATNAIEAGVDIPTVAKWLGHKDGGALAMKVYGHVRDDHSLKSIEKLGRQPSPSRIESAIQE